LKWELKVEEFGFGDFLFGSNSFGFDERSAMKWFDEWVYDINYDTWTDIVCNYAIPNADCPIDE